MNARLYIKLACIFFCSSCATTKTPEGCAYGDFYSAIESGAASLSIVFGAEELNPDSFIAIETKDSEGVERNLTLAVAEKEIPIALEYSTDACPVLSWAAYDIEIEPHEWNAFFQPRELKTFGIGLAFIKPGIKATIGDTAFIVYETFSNDVILICGCAES